MYRYRTYQRTLPDTGYGWEIRRDFIGRNLTADATPAARGQF